MTFSRNFKQQIHSGQPLIGTIQSLNVPEITELLVLAGFDWLFIDLEHSPIDVPGAQSILQAAASRCPCIIRVPSHDEIWLKKVLDIGAHGVIVPQVKSAAEAEQIIQCCYYPPQGTRSVGLARAHDYGMGFNRYIAEANQDISIILQIEHIDAVNQIESIARVPGIDALFIGPYDLSGSLGKIGQVNDHEVLDCIKKVQQVCQNLHMPVGIFTANPQQVPDLVEQGFTVIAVGIDTMLFGQTLKQILQAIKDRLKIPGDNEIH